MGAILRDTPFAENATQHIIGAVRHAFYGWHNCRPSQRRVITSWENEQPTITTLFRTAQDTMMALQGAGLTVACPGTVAITKHERSLIRATAAAQDTDDTLMDNFLSRLAPHPRARPVLARAVTTLADSLSSSGHWLSEAPFPAPALGLLRLRGIDPGRLRVAWPMRGPHAQQRETTQYGAPS